MKNINMSTSPYWNHIGLREIELKDGTSIVELPVKTEVTQRRGTVHGGVIAGMVDAAVGAATRSLLSENQHAVTLELKLNYIRPASGTKLIGKGKLIHKGRLVVVGEARIFNDEEKVVASGMATFMIVPK